MKINLTKSQITDLYSVMTRKGKEQGPLYDELKAIIRLYPRVDPEKLFELNLSADEVKMVRELLVPPEREITPDRIFEEMKKDKKRQF